MGFVVGVAVGCSVGVGCGVAVGVGVGDVVWNQFWLYPIPTEEITTIVMSSIAAIVIFFILNSRCYLFEEK